MREEKLYTLREFEGGKEGKEKAGEEGGRG